MRFESAEPRGCVYILAEGDSKNGKLNYIHPTTAPPRVFFFASSIDTGKYSARAVTILYDRTLLHILHIMHFPNSSEPPCKWNTHTNNVCDVGVRVCQVIPLGVCIPAEGWFANASIMRVVDAISLC